MTDDRIIVVTSERAVATAWARERGISPRRIIHIASRDDLHRIQGTRGLPNTWIVRTSGAIRDVAAIVECLRILESPYWVDREIKK